MLFITDQFQVIEIKTTVRPADGVELSREEIKHEPTFDRTAAETAVQLLREAVEAKNLPCRDFWMVTRGFESVVRRPQTTHIMTVNYRISCVCVESN